MALKYNKNGVYFDRITEPIRLTGGGIIGRGKYNKDENNNILEPNEVVNAIDIDWNNARSQNIPIRISSTDQLLSLIDELYAYKNSDDNIRHIILTAEEYEALTSYEENTLYMVIGDNVSPVNPGGGGSDTPEQEERVFDNISTNLQISYEENGQLITNTYSNDGKISLDPQKKYTISGTLIGYIEIDTTNKVINDNTEIILNDVKILTEDSNNSIIYKIPKGAKQQKALIITLARNSKNYMYCSNEADIDENQPGVIYSMNNLTIQGAGYLAVQNNGGHGLRGDEFILGGPHIWVSASHDAIHASNLYIIGGVYYIEKGNDGIGTSDDGRVMYYDGTIITTNNIASDIIDSKLPGLYFKDNLINSSIKSRCPNMKLLNEQNFKSIFGSSSIVKGYQTKNDLVSGVNGTDISADSNNIYNITYPFINISGYINGSFNFIDDTIFGRNKDADATVYLFNAYISNSTNNPNFYFGPELDKVLGKLKIICVQDTINILENIYDNHDDSSEATAYEGDCIKSENNIGIEIKNGSSLYISSLKSDGIDGGEVKINDSKGSIIICNCGQRGIKGNAIVIGPDAVITSSVIESYVTNTQSSEYKTFDGVCYVKNNCVEFNKGIIYGSDKDGLERKTSGFADIYCRNGKGTKGVFGTTNNELKGSIITGTIGAVVNIDMGNANNFYYNEIIEADTTVQNPVPSSGIPIIINEVPVTDESKSYIKINL